MGCRVWLAYQTHLVHKEPHWCSQCGVVRTASCGLSCAKPWLQRIPGGHCICRRSSERECIVSLNREELLIDVKSYSMDQSRPYHAVGAWTLKSKVYSSNIQDQVQLPLTLLTRAVSMQVSQRLANSTNLASILTTSPQTIAAPVLFTIQNLRPFDQTM